MEDTPFCFDTGMTSHISPIKVDFMELKPITPRNIWGVNGMVIPAIGTCLINVRYGKGRRIILRDILYAPHATLHLISVGQLGDEGYTTVFDAKHCHVLCNNRTLAQGDCKGKSLYKLPGDPCTMEHANIA